MHQLFTYTLLLAVVAAQLFDSFSAARLQCTEVGCQCSVEARPARSCCSAIASDDVGGCCDRSRASCCSSSGTQGSRGGPAICRCGCQHSSTPAPAQTDTTSTELLRLICQSSPAIHAALVANTTTALDTATPSSSFYGELSVQPLYCSWLI